jgi:hypothetical protein
VRRTLFVCVLGAALLIPFQGTSAQNVLPPTFGQWPVSPNPVKFIPFDLTSDAPVLQEFGFKSSEHQEYARGAERVSVTLYQMVDPTAAYGAFTYFRSTNMTASKLAQYAAVSPTNALIVVGNFLLDVSGQRINQSAPALEALILSVKPKSDPRPYPIIAEHLPPDGLIPSSVRYAIGPLAMQKYVPVGSGDWIGFSQGAEAVTGRYRKGKEEVTILIAEYPTQQIAGKNFAAMSTVLHPDPPVAENATRVVGSLREADLVVLAISNHAGQFPDGLVREVNYGHYVTENEGKFKATEPSMPVYIIGGFVLSGAIMLIAIVSGLGFAVFRLVVKKFFPGKVFDRPRSMEVIQLGLSERPVNMKDFY